MDSAVSTEDWCRFKDSLIYRQRTQPNRSLKKTKMQWITPETVHHCIETGWHAAWWPGRTHRTVVMHDGQIWADRQDPTARDIEALPFCCYLPRCLCV